MKIRYSLAIAGLCALALAGCNSQKATEQFRDAPRSAVVNDQSADVIEMPDGFSNLATKCDHGNRIYVAFHGDSAYASLTAVAHDPSCAGVR